MDINFYSPVHFEKWDWRNSIEKGIGGSERHVEMAWRLARRGYQVISYAPIPKDSPKLWRDTQWIDFRKADFNKDGLWVLYRCPSILDKFGPRRVGQPRWLMCQDEWYMDWTPERAEKVDVVLALCSEHKKAMEYKAPYLKDKIAIVSNGVKMDLIREVDAENLERNPHKLVYTSSPDRGLKHLISIFNRAKEFVPDLELHVFYGFDNIDKLVNKLRFLGEEKKQILSLLKNSKGVHWRGRVNQKTLYREISTAGIWCYPSEFTETSCISCMEAQALGAIPIFNPWWALRDNVKHGISIVGRPYSDALTRARYVSALVRLARFPDLQSRIRFEMVSWARLKFNWERQVDQWECMLYGLPNVPAQFTFQLKHATGRILNLGCAGDPVNFAALGAVNIDVIEKDPNTGHTNKAHLFTDIRNHIPKEIGKFDSVILGEVLEHFHSDDELVAIRNAAKMLNDDGKIIITCPDDTRPAKIQQPGFEFGSKEDLREYAPGVKSTHFRSISLSHLESQLRKSGLKIDHYQIIDYTHFTGHGIVASRK